MLLVVVGNRPHFIKLAPLAAELDRRGLGYGLVHSGQHHDDRLSRVFFEELGLPGPIATLGVAGGNDADMIGRLLIALAQAIGEVAPQGVVVIGDTNTTLAATLAAAKLGVPVAHIEAGPRMHDRRIPEELNRVLVDHAATLCFAPDATSVANLAAEGLTRGVVETGDLMLDAYLRFAPQAARRDILTGLPGELLLATCHRQATCASPGLLAELVDILMGAPWPAIIPLHPRARAALAGAGLLGRLLDSPRVTVLEPLGYLDVLALLQVARAVVTDSGGLQREALFARRPCHVLLPATPWPAIEAAGWQQVHWGQAGFTAREVLAALVELQPTGAPPEPFGDGRAAARIVDALDDAGWLG